VPLAEHEAKKRDWLKPTLYAFLVFLIFGLISIALTYLFGDECWFQRLGALVVGAGIAIEAYALYEPGKVLEGWGAGSPDHIKIKTAILCMLLGTIAWGVGDLMLRPFGYCIAI